MLITNNFSEFHLLFTEPVSFTIYKDETKSIILSQFTLALPTVRDMYCNDKITFLLGLLKKSMPELQAEFKTDSLTSHLDIINWLVRNSSKSPSIGHLLHRAISGLQHFCSLFEISDDILTLQKQPVTDELFEQIRSIILTAIGAKSFAINSQYMTPEQRLMEEKIQAIKNKGTNAKADTNFEKIYMILTYEFGYSREEILNMTMYVVKTILKYTSRSINYKLTLAAKAYGNAKKVKFITDQGEGHG